MNGAFGIQDSFHAISTMNSMQISKKTLWSRQWLRLIEINVRKIKTENVLFDSEGDDSREILYAEDISRNVNEFFDTDQKFFASNYNDLVQWLTEIIFGY